MSKGASAPSRTIVYCIVPPDLAGTLHERLRAHFAADPAVEVIVEQRWRDRRGTDDRRQAGTPAGQQEARRRIRAEEGRRVADQRAPVVEVEPPALPRRLGPGADRLIFIERMEPSTDQSEETDSARLVTRFQAGDIDVFAQLYMRYFERVYGYLRVVFRDEHEAEDVTQQVFLQAYEALPNYERRSSPFAAWLFTIARNRALQDRKRLGRVEPVEPASVSLDDGQEVDDGPAAQVLEWISDRELLMFVERLPLAQQQALVLRYVLDMPNAQVAEAMGRSNDDVRMLQSRALRFLRARLVAVGRAPSDRRRTLMRSPLRKSGVLRARRFAIAVPYATQSGGRSRHG